MTAPYLPPEEKDSIECPKVDPEYAPIADELKRLNAFKKESKPSNVITTSLVSIVLFIITVLYLVISQAFVLKTLWGWFVVPIFLVNYLSTIKAMGMILLIKLCVYNNNDIINVYDKEKSPSPKIFSTIMIFAMPWFVLLEGYIIHLFL